MKRWPKLLSQARTTWKDKRLSRCVAAHVMALTLAAPALADDWAAVVIGQTGPSVPGAFADAFHVNKALSDGGFTDVEMLRDRPYDDVLAAIDGLDGHTRALIYVSAPLRRKGDGVLLNGAMLRFGDIVAHAAAAGVTELALLVENCPGERRTLALPTSTEEMTLLTASSAESKQTCATDGARLTDALRQHVDGSASLDVILRHVSLSSDLGRAPVLRVDTARRAPVVMVSSVSASRAVGVETVVSRSGVSMLAPLNLASVRPSSNVAVQASNAPIFLPGAALPVAQGLPQPSIIVGIVNGVTAASFTPPLETGDIAGREVSFDNLEARRAMRAQDPALFATLVEGGAFDPPDGVLAAAIQTELARLGCYESGVDGIWGRGSRASVVRYFDQRQDATPISLDPVSGLFRQMILADDVSCPAVARAAAQPTATTRARTTTTARRTTRQAAPQQATTRTISNSNRLGVFR